jgi:signal transduction histidine kinase
MTAPVDDQRSEARSWEFLGGFFHDIRSPLAAARGALQLLRGDGVLTETRRDALLEALASSIERMTRMVQAVETYQRLARTERLEAGATVDLAELVADAVRNYDTSGRELVVSLEPASVVGDPEAIRAAVDALIDNACTHTPLGTNVEISLVSEDHGVLVVVADDGPGVPDEAKERIFAPFDRGQAPASVMGLGMGLAVVAEVARIHGGRAWAEDTPGGGATCGLYLAESLSRRHTGQARHPSGEDVR